MKWPEGRRRALAWLPLKAVEACEHRDQRRGCRWRIHRGGAAKLRHEVEGAGGMIRSSSPAGVHYDVTRVRNRGCRRNRNPSEEVEVSGVVAGRRMEVGWRCEAEPMEALEEELQEISCKPEVFRYGYVYLLRYRSEVFEKFTEFRCEMEKQSALRLDRGDEYLNTEFLDYLKENEIFSQWTPPGFPQNKEGLLLDNDPISYEKAMLDIDSIKWQEAMQFEMDSMYSNKVVIHVHVLKTFWIQQHGTGNELNIINNHNIPVLVVSHALKQWLTGTGMAQSLRLTRPYAMSHGTLSIT
ncbi:retrotransposon protein [Striga asiatica]|uniref:Retrotransposon protein n=1 Tax=Striga asiatica TaxID=4170 RepID=A0A5A7Q4C3_STRAF|nr:retrotransposon protein [Striga asiatica]